MSDCPPPNNANSLIVRLMRLTILGVIFGFPLSSFFSHTFSLSLEQEVERAKMHAGEYSERCPVYKNATVHERLFDGNVRKLSWCEDYISLL